MKHIKPKIKIKVIYEITYISKLATKVFNLISKMDLGIAEGEFLITER